MQHQREVTLFSRLERVPDEVREELPEEFVEKFTLDPTFVGVDESLPKLCAALSNSFSPPTLVVSWNSLGGKPFAAADLKFDGGDISIFGDVHSRSTHELYDPNELYGALPSPFRGYYKWLDGIQMVPTTRGPGLGWRDLPCRYSSRDEVLDFSREVGFKSSIAKQHYKRFDSKSLQVWILAATGDAFFADEYNARGELYHFHQDRPDELSRVVGDNFLDEYSSFVIERRGSVGFDFSSWLKPLLGSP
jgi:hypothetical protein